MDAKGCEWWPTRASRTSASIRGTAADAGSAYIGHHIAAPLTAPESQPMTPAFAAGERP